MMAIDSSIKGKRRRPAGSQSVKSKMEQSQSAKSKMEQKMDLVKQRLLLLDSSSSESDKDVEFVPMDREIAVVVDHEPIVNDCDYTDDEDDDYAPLRTVRPKRVENEQKELPGVSQTQHLQNTNSSLTNTAKVQRKTGTPVGYQSTKTKMEQKSTLVKKRPALFENGSSNSCESDRDDDAVLMISDVNGQKTCSSVEHNCGTATERAKEVQVKLPAEHPSFIKHMLQSHVIRGFWLGLPCDFCNKHLPKNDTSMVLEDEDGHSYNTTYLGSKQGLSAGWRGFAINHDIKVGDVVVFQLVSSTKFKVYILRANKFSTTDGAIGLLSLDTCNRAKIPKEESSYDVKSKKGPKVTRVNRKVAHRDSENLVSESIEGISFSDSDIEFGEVKGYSNFSIVVDSLVIDCRFPEHLRKTYYELCCAQKSFLHKNLLKKINITLAVGVIMETINIAEGIRACKANASSPDDFVVWKKTLESFELLGMNVSFLLRRIDDFLGLPAQSRDPAVCELYKEMKLERAHAWEQRKSLESKLSDLKDFLKKVDVEMEEIETSQKRRDAMLQHIATAPW